MQSFRTELEHPVVEKDILELEAKIRQYHAGTLDEEKFRSLRLARGVYGQRQPGVQMIRMKIPYGKMTAQQLIRIADVSDEYSNGNLHTTTRQDIQIHYVSLDRTPELWETLERDEITLREACGNTVRNITASAKAGIDPHELFDVSPYAQAAFEYFLRHPAGQELGRKFKIAFSATEADTAFTFMHDLGFIPKIKQAGNQEVRGFRVLLGGGLGAQPRLADVAFDFLPADELLPFIEAVIRVFDRHGERNKRHKARLKFLIKSLGAEKFLDLVATERQALSKSKAPIDAGAIETPSVPELQSLPYFETPDEHRYQKWLQTNVFAQKQAGLWGVSIKLQNGNIHSDTARALAKIVKSYAADDIRITVNQGLLLKFVRKDYLPFLFTQLDELGLAEPGFNSIADITACPGTDTCNLGISNSTSIAQVLEQVCSTEYPELLADESLQIKISGCMNSCGQHVLAAIGFHGSSLKVDRYVAPALQLLLGGGILGDGAAVFADKIIKIPSKRGPAALRLLLDDYQSNATGLSTFQSYYQAQGKAYFYQLLLPLADTSNLEPNDFIDWGQQEKFKTSIGVGECAGVTIDLVATLFLEGEEKLALAEETLARGQYADSIYHSYAAFIQVAKALLVNDLQATNSHAKIITDFDARFIATGKIALDQSFESLVFQIKTQAPSKVFATSYFDAAVQFNQRATQLRSSL